MSGKIDELRKVRYEHRKVGYVIGGLNKKIKLEPNRNDLKAMRAKCTQEMERLDLRRYELLSEIKASPYALVDVVSVLDSLANIQSQIAHGGTEDGQMAISAFIRNLTEDKDRLTELEEGDVIQIEDPSIDAIPDPEPSNYSEWRRMANLRQGLINKLDKKVKNREDAIRSLEIQLVEARQTAAAAWDSGFWNGTTHTGPWNQAAVDALNPHLTEATA